MSYTEISDQFETISSHLKKGGQVTAALGTFFKSYKKLIDTFNQQLAKLCDTLILDFPKEGNVDTLSTALHSLVAFIRKQNQSKVYFSRNLQLDVIEPLELFINHFTVTTTSLFNQGQTSCKELYKCKDRLDKFFQKYIQSSEAAEKSEKLITTEETKEKQDRALRQALYHKNIANRESDRYVIAYNKMNAFRDEFNQSMPRTMVLLQQNEESRIQFLKGTLEKYARFYKTLHTNIAESLDDMNSIISNVNSGIDIRVLVDRLKSRSNEIRKEDFVTYEK